MSPDLIAFLKAWYDWATSGAPEGEPFFRSHGLCASALEHCSGFAEGWLLREKLSEALGRVEYPFSYADYWRRSDTLTQHECPKRLAWVRARLVEAGEWVS